MKTLLRSVIAIISIIFISLPLMAQDNYLTFDLANGKDFVHGVGEVEVIDKRQSPTDTLGIIRAGKMNGKRPLLSKQALNKDIENYFNSLSAISKYPSDKKLVVLIYKFSGNETGTGYTDENAEFVFAADYFLSDQQNKYHLLGMVDTIIKVSSIDVTKKLLRSIDQSLCYLYEHTYTTHPADKHPYTIEEVRRYDDIEKNSHPAFTADHFPNGMYGTWKNFLALQKEEDRKIGKKKKKFKIESLSESGKIKYSPVPVKTKVIAYEGKAYINFGNVFYPLSKMDNDFYFTGRLGEVQRNTGVIVGAGLMFGTVGVLIVVKGNEPPGLDGSTLDGILYDFKVEARTGKAIVLRKSIRPKVTI